MNLHILNCIFRGIFIILISLCISQSHADTSKISSHITSRATYITYKQNTTSNTTQFSNTRANNTSVIDPIDPWVIDQRQAVSNTTQFSNTRANNTSVIDPIDPWVIDQRQAVSNTTQFSNIRANNTSVIDPWVIDQRQTVSAALLNCTSIPALFGRDNIRNILWGLEIQRQWQVSSGRQQYKSSIRIDERSWFAGLNYFLTIVPYLAAMKINLVPQRQFIPPQSNSSRKFPITFETIDHQIAQQWKSFFEKIKILKTDPTFAGAEYLQKILWIAHNTTVTKVLSTFKGEMELQNYQERKFSNGFGHFLEILSIINFNTSYPQINMIKKIFPPRVLRLTDIPPLIFDMTHQQNTIISIFFTIDEMTKVPVIWTRLVETLRNGMTIAKCSVKLEKAFSRFLANPNNGVLDVLLNIVRKC